MFGHRLSPDELKFEERKKLCLDLIKALESEDDDSENELEKDTTDKVFEILKIENSRINDLYDFSKKRMETLKKEDQRLSEYLEEEADIIAVCDDYINDSSYIISEALDNIMELYFKMEILHRQLCRLIRRFAHKRRVVDDSFEDESPSNMSLLDILKLLLYELQPRGKSQPSDTILPLDDRMRKEHLKFLFSAEIIEFCTDYPDCIKLCD